MVTNGSGARLHLQVTPYDCLPTTFVNAIISLCARRAETDDETAEAVWKAIRKIWQVASDREEVNELKTIQRLARALQRVAGLGLDVSFHERSDVGGMLDLCERGSVVALRLYHSSGKAKEWWHYVLVLGVVGDDVLLFDPIRRDKVSQKIHEQHEDLTRKLKERGANLVLPREHIEATRERRRYAMGPIEKRNCVLFRQRG